MLAAEHTYFPSFSVATAVRVSCLASTFLWSTTEEDDILEPGGIKLHVGFASLKFHWQGIDSVWPAVLVYDSNGAVIITGLSEKGKNEKTWNTLRNIVALNLKISVAVKKT